MGYSKKEKASRRPKNRTFLTVLVYGLSSLIVFLVAFSVPPLGKASASHYLAVVFFFTLLIFFWSLPGVILSRIGGYPRSEQLSIHELLTPPVSASLAYGLALLLALYSFGAGTEAGYTLAILFLLMGFCFAISILASYWAGHLKVPHWMVVGTTCLGGPGGLMVSGWLSYSIFGEDFLYYDVMLFL